MRFLPIIVVVALAAGCGKPEDEPGRLTPLPPFVTEPPTTLEAQRRNIREAAEKLMAEQGPSR